MSVVAGSNRHVALFRWKDDLQLCGAIGHLRMAKRGEVEASGEAEAKIRGIAVGNSVASLMPLPMDWRRL